MKLQSMDTQYPTVPVPQSSLPLLLQPASLNPQMSPTNSPSTLTALHRPKF